MKKSYPSDLTTKQWKLIEALLPGESPIGRHRTTNLRDVMNAIFYMSRTGCQWNMLPHDFPPKSTVWDYYVLWHRDHILDDISRVLRERIRILAGRDATPSAGIIDSQSVKTTQASEAVGYDAGKKTKGRKRHILVDIMGLLLGVMVTAADMPERTGAKKLMQKLAGRFPRLEIVFADGGYRGDKLKTWFATTLALTLQIILRPRHRFQVVKFRWIVERTFGWMNSHRRLSKDYEYSVRSSEAWIKIAAINMMVHRLSPG